jgi:hypothetical protein
LAIDDWSAGRVDAVAASAPAGLMVRINNQVSIIHHQYPGDVAQLGERRLCKPEVAGSIPVVSTVPRSGAGPGVTLRIGAATAPGGKQEKIFRKSENPDCQRQR